MVGGGLFSKVLSRLRGERRGIMDEVPFDRLDRVSGGLDLA